MAWDFRTAERNGNSFAYLNSLQNRSMSLLLGRPSTVRASMSAEAGGALDLGLQPGINELKVSRDSEPLETVFVLTNANPSGDTNGSRVEFEWTGIASYLQDALIFSKATPYTGTAVPWGWINTFQSRTGADYGITQGAVVGTASSVSRKIDSDATLLDEIINLSESRGFDWSITPERKYVEYWPTRGNDTGLTLEYGVNVSAYSYNESAGPGEIITDGRVIGPPGSSIATVSDTTARTTYGRREVSINYLTELETATATSAQLAAYGAAAIADRNRPLIIPQLTLRRNHPSTEWGAYWLGDTVRVKIAVGNYTSIDKECRIVGIHIDLDENDNETVRLDLNGVE